MGPTRSLRRRVWPLARCATVRTRWLSRTILLSAWRCSTARSEAYSTVPGLPESDAELAFLARLAHSARLVLSATCSGNGKATPPSSANAAALVNAAKTGDTDAIMALIFPANQLAAQESAYTGGVSAYPNFYQAPEALAVAQHAAISRWADGAVSAGHRHIAAPTLIGDGADDVMTPPANVQQDGSGDSRSSLRDLPRRRPRLPVPGLVSGGGSDQRLPEVKPGGPPVQTGRSSTSEQCCASRQMVGIPRDRAPCR